METVAQPPAQRPTRVVRLLTLLALQAASLGYFGWSLVYRSDLARHLLRNGLEKTERDHLLAWMLVPLLLAWSWALARMVLRGERGLADTEHVARRLAPLCLAGLVPMLFSVEIWVGHELIHLALVIVFIWGVRQSLELALQAPPLFPSPPGHWLLKAYQEAYVALKDNTVAALVVLFAVAAYALYFSLITINDHHNLQTASYDLGIENNIVWNAAHGLRWFKASPAGGPDFSHFGVHATFLTFLIAPLYRLVPEPETLLVLQAVLTGAAAFPLFLLARHYGLSARQAVLVALVYLLYPPLHGSILYDFHYQPLVPVFLWWTWWAAEKGHAKSCALLALLCLSVREDVGIMLAVVGAYLVLSDRRPVLGLMLVAVSAVHFVVLKLVLMPRWVNGFETFIDQFQGLLGTGEKGFVGVLKTIVTNPMATLQNLFVKDKLVYFLQVMLPLALLPISRPLGLLFCVPGFLFTLMSTGYWPLYQISFQYTAYWTACLFIMLVIVLGELQTRGKDLRPVYAALLAATLLCSFQYGAVFQHQHVRAEFGLFQFGSTPAQQDRYRRLLKLVEHIPPQAKVVASEWLVPHVSGRPDAYSLKYDLYDAEYLLFQIPMRGDERPKVIAALTKQGFGVLVDDGDMVLAQRGHDPGANLPVLARLRD